MVVETKKILDPKIKLTATCVRVPVFVGHSEAVNIEFEKPISPDEARDVLRDAPGVSVIDKREAGGYATPIEAVGEYDTYVSRIREDVTVENGLVDVGGLRQSPQGRGAQHRADPRNADRAQARRAQGRVAAGRDRCRLRDILLALAVATVWGLSFIAIRWGVDEVSPLLLTALRYVVAALPAVVLHPAARRSDWRILVAYGLAIGVGQFGLLFLAHQARHAGGAELAGHAAPGVLHDLPRVRGVRRTARQRSQIVRGARLPLPASASSRSSGCEGAALVPLAADDRRCRVLGRRQHRQQEGRPHRHARASSSGARSCRRSRCSLLSLILEGPGSVAAALRAHHLARRRLDRLHVVRRDAVRLCGV